MNIYITQTDIYSTNRLAIIEVAKKLNVNDIDWKSSNELFEEIKNSGQSLFSLLNDYLLNYSSWVEFIQEHQDGKDYSQDEQQQIDILTKNRDLTRINLKKGIDSF